jgi:hypothetical protein
VSEEDVAGVGAGCVCFVVALIEGGVKASVLVVCEIAAVPCVTIPAYP